MNEEIRFKKDCAATQCEQTMVSVRLREHTQKDKSTMP